MWYPGLPDDTSIETKPSKSNPNGLTWKQVKDKYGFEGVEFKNKEPDFRPFSRGHVIFKEGQYTSKRRKNFRMADKQMANQLNDAYEKKYGEKPSPLYTRNDVKKWRKKMAILGMKKEIVRICKRFLPFSITTFLIREE